MIIPQEIIFQLDDFNFLKLTSPFIVINEPCDNSIIFALTDRSFQLLLPSSFEVTQKLVLPCYRFVPNYVTPFDEYGVKFQEAQKYLEKGKLSKIVLTITENGRFFSEASSKKLLDRESSHYFYAINFGDFDFVGFSPDPFIRQKIGNRPILEITAGTSLDLTKLPTKEMDVSIANYRDWKVNDCRVVKAGELYHLRATLTAPYDKVNIQNLLEIYPPETIFGSPYGEAVLFNNRLNPVEHPWGSLVGFWGDLADGSIFRSLLCIRGAFLFKNGTYKIIAGSGVVAGYTCDKEYSECLDKVRSIKNLLSET